MVALKANLATELELVGRLAHARSWAIIQTLMDALYYEAVFVRSGLDEFTRRTADPAQLSPLSETMGSFALANWLFLETPASGLRLFALRLGVLALAMPLFLITAIAAAVDGLVTWYLRRTGAGREPGFV